MLHLWLTNNDDIIMNKRKMVKYYLWKPVGNNAIDDVEDTMRGEEDHGNVSKPNMILDASL